MLQTYTSIASLQKPTCIVLSKQSGDSTQLLQSLSLNINPLPSHLNPGHAHAFPLHVFLLQLTLLLDLVPVELAQLADPHPSKSFHQTQDQGPLLPVAASNSTGRVQLGRHVVNALLSHAGET